MATALHELQSGCTFLRCSHNEEHGRSRGKLETTLSKLADNCAWCTEFPITRLATGLFVQIMTYLFGSTVEDVEERLNDFLELVRRYEDANGTDPVPDKVKNACMIALKTEILPELWPLHDISLDSEMDRWLDHTFAPHASQGKTLKICAKHISKIAQLEPKNGSCRTSD